MFALGQLRDIFCSKWGIASEKELSIQESSTSNLVRWESLISIFFSLRVPDLTCDYYWIILWFEVRKSFQQRKCALWPKLFSKSDPNSLTFTVNLKQQTVLSTKREVKRNKKLLTWFSLQATALLNLQRRQESHAGTRQYCFPNILGWE